MAETTTEPATVWEQNGAPTRLEFRGEIWRVMGPLVPLIKEPDALPEGLTHPPSRHVGWRLLVRSEAGRSLTTDLIRSDAGWIVERVEP
ncbi:hypothetical protein ACFCVO_19560 [Agromyces sp. NPDC056379]|uniref:hypothetical protein n=1 Tax=unclassified Agromyces TaxID=2639701 RepID=UPI0035E36916